VQGLKAYLVLVFLKHIIYTNNITAISITFLYNFKLFYIRCFNLKLLLVLFVSVISLLAISPEQLRVLQDVRDVARTISDKNGVTYEDTISAICLTESSAGKNIIGDFKPNIVITSASLGVMQVQVATARYLSTRINALAWLKQLSNAQIANKLLSDVELSARISSHYIVLLINHRKNYFKAVSGYNGGMINHPYYARVMKNMKLIRKLKLHGKIT